MWLALRVRGWSPASHPHYPEQLRATFRTVLLAAAGGCIGLASLPKELLLHILCLAARPLTMWVPTS